MASLPPFATLYPPGYFDRSRLRRSAGGGEGRPDDLGAQLQRSPRELGAEVPRLTTHLV
jgi:hypothetical protein